MLTTLFRENNGRLNSFVMNEAVEIFISHKHRLQSKCNKNKSIHLKKETKYTEHLFTFGDIRLTLIKSTIVPLENRAIASLIWINIHWINYWIHTVWERMIYEIFFLLVWYWWNNSKRGLQICGIRNWENANKIKFWQKPTNYSPFAAIVKSPHFL